VLTSMSAQGAKTDICHFMRLAKPGREFRLGTAVAAHFRNHDDGIPGVRRRNRAQLDVRDAGPRVPRLSARTPISRDLGSISISSTATTIGTARTRCFQERIPTISFACTALPAARS
jgi:hypothetical protein